MRTKREDKTEVAPYELKLPEQFDLKPDWTVELPGGRSALIFEEEITKEVRRGGEWEEIPTVGWRVVVVNRAGNVMRGCDGRGQHFSKELDVTFHLKSLALHFSKTKRTQVEQTDYDDE